jgi:small multidrug resistance pump
VSVWLLLALAIAAEVAGTTALRASNGFSRPGPVTVVVVTYLLSFVLLALILRHLSLGTTYAIWSGIGTAAIALVGWAVYSDRLSMVTIAGIALVVLGVVVIHLGGGAQR